VQEDDWTKDQQSTLNRIQQGLDQLPVYRDVEIGQLRQWLNAVLEETDKERIRFNNVSHTRTSVDELKKRLWQFCFPYNLNTLDKFLGLLSNFIHDETRNEIEDARRVLLRFQRWKALSDTGDTLTFDDIFLPDPEIEEERLVRLTEEFADDIRFLERTSSSELTLEQFKLLGSCIILGFPESGKSHLCHFFARHILRNTGHRLAVIGYDQQNVRLQQLQQHHGDRVLLFHQETFTLEALFAFLRPEAGAPEQRGFVLFDHPPAHVDVDTAIDFLGRFVRVCGTEAQSQGITFRLFFRSAFFDLLPQREQEEFAQGGIYNLKDWEYTRLLDLFNERTRIIYEQKNRMDGSETLSAERRHYVRKLPNIADLLAPFSAQDTARLARHFNGKPGAAIKIIHDLLRVHCFSQDVEGGDGQTISPRLLDQILPADN
jgi:hypothetical protein